MKDRLSEYLKEKKNYKFEKDIFADVIFTETIKARGKMPQFVEKLIPCRLISATLNYENKTIFIIDVNGDRRSVHEDKIKNIKE